MGQAGSVLNPLRSDIQLLRGLAVMLVVLFHAKLVDKSASYLGVDVFFVISGYLITSHIVTSIKAGKFNLYGFWRRRAYRLIPAAYFTFIVTWLASVLILSSAEFRQLGSQLLGGIFFVSNFVLWKQSGYFYGEAELKPLLHTWSLAVEGQYYFLIPLLFIAVPRKYWLSATLFAAFSSFALCLVYQAKEAAFYLLPFRAWELLLGSVVALVPVDDSRFRSKRKTILLVIAWCVIAVMPLMPLRAAHPGLPALILCLCTAFVLGANQSAPCGHLFLRPLVKIGDFSYSVYLVHWPIFAFANNIWLSDNPIPVGYRISLVLLSLILAYALYRLVELPFSGGARVSSRTFFGGVSFVVVALITSVFLVGDDSGKITNETAARTPNHGFGVTCAESGSRFSPKPGCQSDPGADVLVWGDSFAMHLVEGLVKSRDLRVVQATKALCGPMIGLAVVRGRPSGNREAAESCLSFNDSVASWLASDDAKRIRLVVLSSPFDQFLSSEEVNLVRSGELNTTAHIDKATSQQAMLAIRRTVAAIRATGKRVVLVAPPPFADYDIARCLDRLSTAKPLAGAPADCRIPVRAYEVARGQVLRFLEDIESDKLIDIVRFDAVLCDGQYCDVRVDGSLVYNDKGHLARAGGIALMKHIDIH